MCKVGLKLYCKSMGKIFKVCHIALDDKEANEYCASHKDCGAIAVNQKNGLVFIADLYSLKVSSNVLPD